MEPNFRILSKVLIMLVLYIISEVKAINIDSLEKILQQPNLPDTQKVRITNVLAFHLVYKDIEKAEEYAKTNLSLCDKLDDKLKKSKCNKYSWNNCLSKRRICCCR